MKALLYITLLTCSVIASAQQKAISWFEPSKGGPGTQVIVGVKGYASDDASTEILIGGKIARLLKKSTDHFVVSIPEGAVNGLIMIRDGEGQISSSEPFITGIASKTEHETASLKTGQAVSLASAMAVNPATTATAVNPATTSVANAAGVSKPRFAIKTTPQKAVILPTEASTTTGLPDEPEHIVDHGKLPMANSDAVPLILGISPKNGPAGTLIKISGLNFGFDKTNVRVTVKNGAEFTVSSVYDQTIEVTVPAGMHQSGNLVVFVNGKKAISRQAFHTL